MIIIDCEQGTREWFEARRGVPTASRFGSIITPTKGDLSKAAATYIYELIGERYDPDYGDTDDYVSAAMKNGLMMEPEARSMYEFDRGADLRMVGFVLDDDERFGCSPDALVGDDGGLEIKSPEAKTHAKYLLKGELPTEYRPQVHGSMVVTGRKWWDFMSYLRGMPPLIVRVEWDEYTDKVADALAKFWPKYDAARNKVQAMQPPTVQQVEDEDPVIM